MDYVSIKIKQENGKKSYWKKDKIFCVDIKYPYGDNISFCHSTLKKLFKQIKDNLHI